MVVNILTKNNKQELISIIIPVYKVEKYLDRCISSITNQSYINLEIIIVDDGSPDKCPEMCDLWAKKDSRIIIIHRKNGGLSAARNTGLDKANGDYIAFVDSDDYIAPTMIEELHKAIKKENADLSICGIKKIKETEDIEYQTEYKLKNINEDSYIALKNMYGTNSILHIVVWNKLYRKNLFNNLRFDEGRIHEDVLIMHKILYQCNKITCISKSLYYYIIRKNSITNKTCFDTKNMDAFYAHLKHIDFFKEKHFNSLYNLALVSTLNWCVGAINSIQTSNRLKKEIAINTIKQLKVYIRKNIISGLLGYGSPISLKMRLIIMLINPKIIYTIKKLIENCSIFPQ